MVIEVAVVVFNRGVAFAAAYRAFDHCAWVGLDDLFCTIKRLRGCRIRRRLNLSQQLVGDRYNWRSCHLVSPFR